MSNSQHHAMAAPVCIIGGGPAGLMAAEVLALAGYNVQLFDAMPSLGRKFLLAGIGGLNITHSEDKATLSSATAHKQIGLSVGWLCLMQMPYAIGCMGLGIETFVGSSGQVSPKEMKAQPRFCVVVATPEGLGRASSYAQSLAGLRMRKVHYAWPQTQVSTRCRRALCCWPWVVAAGRVLGSDAAWIPVLQQRRRGNSGLRGE